MGGMPTNAFCIGRHAQPRAILLWVLMFSGCAGTLQYKQLATTAGNLPPAHELIATAFYPQKIHHCGPAALATVLNSADLKVSPEQLAQLVYLPQRKGSLTPELSAAVRHYGYLPYQLQPDLATLLHEIANGRPVLVLQNLGLAWIPRWHYAVVIGYDLPNQQIILRSGIHHRVLTDLSTFERTWRRGDRWALVILPPGQMPARPEESRYLQAVAGLERTRQWPAARSSYLAAIGRWPLSLIAWMGLGNTEYALHNLSAATAAYRKTLTINDRYAPAYNNLAQVLAEQKNWGEAEQMARYAVDLGGIYIEDYKKTLADILQKQL